MPFVNGALAVGLTQGSTHMLRLRVSSRQKYKMALFPRTNYGWETETENVYIPLENYGTKEDIINLWGENRRIFELSPGL